MQKNLKSKYIGFTKLRLILTDQIYPFLYLAPTPFFFLSFFLSLSLSLSLSLAYSRFYSSFFLGP